MSEAAATEIVVEGVGLHTGVGARVRLERRPGPLAIRLYGGLEYALREWAIVGTVRGMTIASSGGTLRVATPDHLFGALAGLGVHRDLCISIDGPEVPLLDGCASAWCEALAAIGFDQTFGGHPPTLHVTRNATIETRGSVYVFEPSNESTRVEVDVTFGDVRVDGLVSWSGSRSDFERRIAPARTFAFARELEAIAMRGLAKHVAPESVVVIDEGRIYSAGRTPDGDEPARHKLLDLLGDLYLYGGPPMGFVRASKPGHGSTHEAMRQAIDEGVVGPLNQK